MEGANSRGEGFRDAGTWRDTLIALFLSGAAFVTRQALHPLLGSDYPYLTFLLAVIYSAWRCRWPVSAAVLVLGWLMAHWFFIPPLHMIKVTAGADAPERCSQAFTVAAVAVASGVEVSLWLTGESAWFALPGRAAEFELPHAAPLPDLIDSILAGGRLTLCTQCAARRDITERDVIEGVRIAGAQVFVQESLADDTQALVY